MKLLMLLTAFSLSFSGTHYIYENLNHIQNDLFAVSGTDTLTIRNCTLTVNTDIFANSDGIINFENDTIVLNGNLHAWDRAKVRFNRCSILWNGTFVYQYSMTLSGGASMVMDSTRMTMPNNSGMSVKDSASFSCTATQFQGSWTKSAENRSRLSFVDCIHAHEFLVNDSSTLSFTRCTDVLTWLFFPKGSYGTLQIPGDTGYRFIDTFHLGPQSDSLKGIHYEVTMDSTTNIWGCIPQAGCDVTLHDSRIRVMGFILMDSITPYRISHLDNYTFFPNKLISLPDRTLRLVNTYVMTFNVYPMLGSEVHLDSSTVGEIISYHNSRTFLNHVTVDASGGFFGLEGGSHINAENCNLLCAIKVQDSAKLKMNYSTAPFTTTVLRSGQLLASNSFLSPTPDLRDSARYLSVNMLNLPNLDTLALSQPIVTDLRNLSGPKATPYTLRSYAVAAEIANARPILLASIAPHTKDTLTLWRTDTVTAGSYYLLVPVITELGDTVTAFRLLIKAITSPAIKIPYQTLSQFSGQPNPFSSHLIFDFGNTAYANTPLDIFIYDLQGRQIQTLSKAIRNTRVNWNGRTAAGCKSAAGVYVITVKTAKGNTATRLFSKLH